MVLAPIAVPRRWAPLPIHLREQPKDEEPPHTFIDLASASTLSGIWFIQRSAPSPTTEELSAGASRHARPSPSVPLVDCTRAAAVMIDWLREAERTLCYELRWRDCVVSRPSTNLSSGSWPRSLEGSSGLRTCSSPASSTGSAASCSNDTRTANARPSRRVTKTPGPSAPDEPVLHPAEHSATVGGVDIARESVPGATIASCALAQRAIEGQTLGRPHARGGR
jgi:hypothetical protein